MNAFRCRGSLLAGLIFLGGCAHIPGVDSARTGPFFTPQNVQRSARLPAEVRRVLVLPAACEIALADNQLMKLDEIIRQSLSQKARFEVTPLSREACARYTGSRAINSTAALPHDFLARLATDYAVDAVLFVDITAYSPYPPLTIGLRTKLARTSDQELLWAFDNTFSTVDPTVVNAARRYWLKTAPGNAPTDFSNTVLENPARFTTYATSAAFDTLPTR